MLKPARTIRRRASAACLPHRVAGRRHLQLPAALAAPGDEGLDLLGRLRLLPRRQPVPPCRTSIPAWTASAAIRRCQAHAGLLFNQTYGRQKIFCPGQGHPGRLRPLRPARLRRQGPAGALELAAGQPLRRHARRQLRARRWRPTPTSAAASATCASTAAAGSTAPGVSTRAGARARPPRMTSTATSCSCQQVNDRTEKRA